MASSLSRLKHRSCNAGTGHRTLDGRLLPLSVLNVVDADFTIPYDVNDLFCDLPPPRNGSSHRRDVVASRLQPQVRHPLSTMERQRIQASLPLS